MVLIVHVMMLVLLCLLPVVRLCPHNVVYLVDLIVNVVSRPDAMPFDPHLDDLFPEGLCPIAISVCLVVLIGVFVLSFPFFFFWSIGG